MRLRKMMASGLALAFSATMIPSPSEAAAQRVTFAWKASLDIMMPASASLAPGAKTSSAAANSLLNAQCKNRFGFYAISVNGWSGTQLSEARALSKSQSYRVAEAKWKSDANGEAFYSLRGTCSGTVTSSVSLPSKGYSITAYARTYVPGTTYTVPMRRQISSPRFSLAALKASGFVITLSTTPDYMGLCCEARIWGPRPKVPKATFSVASYAPYVDPAGTDTTPGSPGSNKLVLRQLTPALNDPCCEVWVNPPALREYPMQTIPSLLILPITDGETVMIIPAAGAWQFTVYVGLAESDFNTYSRTTYAIDPVSGALTEISTIYG